MNLQRISKRCGNKMVLVSMIGDFDSSILPIFFEFKDKLTHHVLIHDKNKCDTSKVQKLLDAQEQFKEHYEYTYEIISIALDEDNYTSIIEAFTKVSYVADYDMNNIYFNGTDGLANVTVIFASKLIELGGKFISYDKIENEYNLLTNDGMAKHKILHNMDIKNHLKLKGYEIQAFTNKFELQRRKEQILELTRDLARFKKFTSLVGKKAYDDIHGFQDYKKILESIPNEEINQQFIQGTVFEEYIYWLLKDNFQIDEIMCGVKIKFSEFVINEFDILLIHSNHLNQIECKFVNKLDGEHFVYKAHASLDYLDDEGKGMILSVGGHNETIKNGKTSVQFTKGDLARAKYDDISVFQAKVFNPNEFLEEVKNFLELDTIAK